MEKNYNFSEIFFCSLTRSIRSEMQIRFCYPKARSEVKIFDSGFFQVNCCFLFTRFWYFCRQFQIKINQFISIGSLSLSCTGIIISTELSYDFIQFHTHSNAKHFHIAHSAIHTFQWNDLLPCCSSWTNILYLIFLSFHLNSFSIWFYFALQQNAN